MIMGLFGTANVSHVSRQDIAEKSPTCTELNGKLLNIVFDGQHTYLKDSGLEKTLIAGEPAAFRLLYESTPTIVQTNALFIESLNKEPKSNDKSTALQARLVRFLFPHVYKLDRKFERAMLNPEALGAFLSLLIDRYVVEEELATQLAPTQKAMELQLEAMHANSLGLQFIKWVEETDVLGAETLIGAQMHELVIKFQSWRLKENDIGQWAEPDIQAMFLPLLNTERRSVRENNKVRKVRVITSFKPEATAFIESLKGETDDEDILAAVVED
jgi:phage/plasmid-associated DNA primase